MDEVSEARSEARAEQPSRRPPAATSAPWGTLNPREAFYGPNAGYAMELYERYLADPGSVDAATRAFFDRAEPSLNGAVAGERTPSTPLPTNGRSADWTAPVAPPSAAPASPAPPLDDREVLKVVHAARLARSIREYGHLDAAIDPLGARRPGDPMLDPATHNLTVDDLRTLPASIVWPSAGREIGNCFDAITMLREIYSGPIGYDFDHVQDFTERAWLHTAVESGTFRTPLSPDQQRSLLRRLATVDGFERFLNTVFQGQKRFSIEGNDTLIPMLDEIVNRALEGGIGEIAIGMAHRGRLNVLAHVLCKPLPAIFSEFHSPVQRELAPPDDTDPEWRTGDVKYHLGWQRTVRAGDRELKITLADNPSHLEFVNPVVEGFTRAAQDILAAPGAPGQDIDRALCVAIHGDAAFPGEGVVAETLNLSHLPGYATGGTIHIIVNNQIGFTTSAAAGRSTLYASDLAKGFEIPIVHVNADEPEACMHVMRLANAYRQRFHKDFLIDLIGYRRWGHNETDEPAFTQPRLYNQIGAHPRVSDMYAQRLEAKGVVTSEGVTAMRQEIEGDLRAARDAAESGQGSHPEAAREPLPARPARVVPLTSDLLTELNDALLARPDGYTPNPKLERVLARRREALIRPGGIDWSHAENLAFATILMAGTPIRLTGQDVERGTFSQRHLVLHDPETGAEYVPLQHLPEAEASIAVYNSPLSEAAAIGYEYGYSVHAPEALVLWEAQFGDFANAGQVLIDQFIAAARAKWFEQPALVLLLPHGYEGAGPEHSSARLERFLQLAAEDNLRVLNLTTSAQYFHALRLQAELLLSDARRPVVIMTPKSLLRHPRAGSSLDDLVNGRFQPVIDDDCSPEECEKVTRLVLVSGKVAVDLATTRHAGEGERHVDWVAVARVEQLYPFPEDALRGVIGAYPNLREVAWLQEEPRNMGAWSYMAQRLPPLLPSHVELRYIGRPERASTAEGSQEAHAWEQERIVEAAFEGEHPANIETQGEESAD